MNNILDIVIDSYDLGFITFREYFTELLCLVWVKGESFSGKRPFGNSDWQYIVYTSLVKSGHVSGTLDDEGLLITCDYAKADMLIINAIRQIYNNKERKK